MGRGALEATDWSSYIMDERKICLRYYLLFILAPTWVRIIQFWRHNLNLVQHIRQHVVVLGARMHRLASAAVRFFFLSNLCAFCWHRAYRGRCLYANTRSSRARAHQIPNRIERKCLEMILKWMWFTSFFSLFFFSFPFHATTIGNWHSDEGRNAQSGNPFDAIQYSIVANNA